MIRNTPEGNQTLYRLMPVEILLQLAALAIFTHTYWGRLPENHIVSFITVVASVNLYSFIIVFYLRYFGDSKAEGHGTFASVNFLLGNFLCGLSWGGGFVVLSIVSDNLSLSDTLIPVLMAGVVMASLAGSALWSWLFLAFAIPALFSPLAWLLLQEAFTQTTIWGQLMLVSVLTFWGTVRAESAFNRYRQNSRQNVNLVQELAAAKQAAVDNTIELERAHDKLTVEIEERKVIEEKIRASEKETARILSDMQDTYFQVDAKGYIKRLSPSIQTLLGQ